MLKTDCDSSWHSLARKLRCARDIADVPLPPLPSDADDDDARARSDACRRTLIEVLVQLRFVEPCRSALEAMRRGFQTVSCVPNFAAFFNRAEYVRFVCGDEELSSKALWDLFSFDPEHYSHITIERGHHFNHAYREDEPVMRWLREAIDEFTPHMRKGFFFFVTGLHGVPLGGDFRILVDKKPNIAWLPSTSTCYNTLHLPPYESKRDLKVKLKTAIRNSMNGGTGEL